MVKMIDVPKYVVFQYRTESKEVADTLEQVINDLPIKIDTARGTSFVVTGHDKRKHNEKMFRDAPFCIFGQLNQMIDSIVNYENLQNLDPERYEVDVEVSTALSWSNPSLNIRDKKLRTDLTIYLSQQKWKDLPQKFMKYERNVGGKE